MKYLSLIITFCFMFISLHGQEADRSGFFLHHRLYKAHKDFSQNHYHDAAAKYEKLYNKGKLNNIEKGDYAEVLLNLHQNEEAEKVLDKIPNRTLHEDELLIRAAMYNGNYAKAEKLMNSHPELEILDMKISGSRSLEEYIMYEVKQDHYTVREAQFNSEQADFSAYGSDDKIYFASDRGGKHIVKRGNKGKNTAYLNVYETSDSINVKKIKDKINDGYHNGPICLNNEENIIFVTQNNYTFTNYGNKKEDDNTLMIFMGRLKDNGKWGDFIPLPFNSEKYSCSHPFLSSDDKTLYFTSDMPDGYGETDIYKVSFSGESFGVVENLGDQINTSKSEMFPFEASNGDFYFSSDGYAGYGGLDIYVKENKASKTKIHNLGYPINSTADDFSMFMNDDKTGFFASNREEGTGSDDIYIFKGTNLYTDIIVKVIDKETRQILTGVEVHLTDSILHTMDMGVSNESGLIYMSANTSYNTLHFDVMDYENYKPYIVDLPKTDKTYLLPLTRYDLGIYGYAYDKMSSEKLENVHIHILHNNIEEKDLLARAGDYRQALMPENKYTIVATKSNYLPYEFSTDTRDYDGWKEYNIPMIPSLKIKDILYDFDKFNIRTEAAKDLDATATYMNRYPEVKIRLESHTDARGSIKYNQELSLNRAISAKKYLVDKGIDGSRIEIESFGKERLKNKCTDCDAESHQENRRTEINVIQN